MPAGSRGGPMAPIGGWMWTEKGEV